MIPLRCTHCNKMLGMIEGKAEIKCPRCKELAKFCTYEAIKEFRESTNR